MNIVSYAVNAFKKGLNTAQATLWTFYKTFDMGCESMGFESTKPKPCLLNGKSYRHGAEIMAADAQILECIDGEWKERVNPFITVGP